MSTTTTKTVTLDDCECEETRQGDRTRYTHESGAYVEIIHDECPHHPLDDVEASRSLSARATTTTARPTITRVTRRSTARRTRGPVRAPIGSSS